MRMTLLLSENIRQQWLLTQHLRARGKVPDYMRSETAKAQLIRAGLLTFPEGTAFISNGQTYWPVYNTN